MSHTALLVIDAQRAFENDPAWSTPSTAAWLERQNLLIAHAQHAGWPTAAVLHISRNHFAPGSDGTALLPGLTLPPGPQFSKHVHNALDADGLRDWLRDLTISHLVISGIRTEQCCETTARAARDAGYDVDFVLDATLTFDMPAADGNTVTANTIKYHTATVLHRRFAHVTTVDELTTRTVPIALNRYCPRSGKPIREDSLTQYRQHTVGFCNPGCSTDFAQQPTACPADQRHFDRLIALQSGAA